jgi:hypothetical protein
MVNARLSDKQTSCRGCSKPVDNLNKSLGSFSPKRLRRPIESMQPVMVTHNPFFVCTWYHLPILRMLGRKRWRQVQRRWVLAQDQTTQEEVDLLELRWFRQVVLLSWLRRDLATAEQARTKVAALSENLWVHLNSSPLPTKTIPRHSKRIFA